VLLIGFTTGTVLAGLLTVFAISTRIGTDFLETMTAMFNPLPAIALLPLALIWFGLGAGSLVFVLVHSVMWAVALNTLAVVLTTATVTVLASLLIAWIAGRTQFAGRRLLDQLAFVSHGLPGVILGLALIWFWVRLDFVPIYGTLAIVVLGLGTGFLAYGTRSMSAALVQVHRELEEAAYASGAAPAGAVRRVLAPLLMPALASLWVWVAIQALRLVTLPLMLQTGPENTVVASYLWRRWEAGEVNLVAAVGIAMVLAMALLIALVTRLGLTSRRASLLQ
jgi:iron(III) transport system permease protein